MRTEWKGLRTGAGVFRRLICLVCALGLSGALGTPRPTLGAEAPRVQNLRTYGWGRTFLDTQTALDAFRQETISNAVYGLLNPPEISVQRYGAVGDYTGKMATAGTGTDNRVAIQAALDAAYTQGASYGDTIGNTSHHVVIPKGKYYIGAPADGTPSLKVPLKVVLDFSEAELHFGLPLRNYTNNGITEPNPAWCAILVGNQGGLIIGHMQTKAGSDHTYAGAWTGMNLDAIRVQEADISWIKGGGKDHRIFNFRGAGIRYIACWNAFVEGLDFANTTHGVIMSYFGTAFTNYTRYRGTSDAESVSTSMWLSRCSFVNIYTKAILAGVSGDWHAPSSGGFETETYSHPGNGGPISINQCAFENVAEECVRVFGPANVFVNEVRLEEIGGFGGAIFGQDVTALKVDGVYWVQGGRNCTRAIYTGTGYTSPYVPDAVGLLYATTPNVAPFVANAFVNNTYRASCKWVDGTTNYTRLPVLINVRAGQTNQMQGTSAYMQGMIPENDGGRIWSVSTVGIAPVETVNGSATNFSFVNGLNAPKPRYLRQDGLNVPETNSDGSTNWTWSGTNVTTVLPPTKDLRAFF